MEYILAAGAGVFLILFILSTLIATRRRNRVGLIEKQLDDQRRQIRELEERLDAKNRQVEQLGNQVDRMRDEAKKAKKKAYDLEQRGRESTPSEKAEFDRIQEEALQEARNQAGQARNEADQSAEECSRLRDQLERLKTELQETKSSLRSRQNNDKKGQKENAERLKRLEKENRELNKKLQAAKRKARTDSQVYKVTKSKLDLAMEKIQLLEKKAKDRTGNGSTTVPPAP